MRRLGRVFLALLFAINSALLANSNAPDRQGRLTAIEAANIDVTPLTWRAVQEALDDVFSNEQISEIRQPAMQRFVEAMTAADSLEAWPERDAARTAARRELLGAMEQMVALQASLQDPDARNEAAIATIELMLHHGDFEAAMKSAEAALAGDLPPALKAQTYRLLSRAAIGSGNEGAAPDAWLRFAREMPAESDHTRRPFGPVRFAVRMFGDAQMHDDVALRNPELAQGALRLRDQSRRAAREFLDARAPSPTTRP